MKPIIRVDGLSKQYRIGSRHASYATLRESLAGALRAPAKLLSRNGTASADTIWALRDVSFEVMPGEVIGVIGRNGAGKSTLLKILSRITEPTSGQVDLYGRVGSLLEVGTGFHAELTGRENIYLNGAILGMKKAEIDRKFDEIVAFAEVEKFIDTPVKRYSSGMYLRLAFANAAHFEPEILIVDEVLAVGDAAFQKKCLGRMEDVAKRGRTVLLVSHNMVAITQLCHECIWLDKGLLTSSGPSAGVVREYASALNTLREDGFSLDNVKGDGRIQLVSYRVTNRLDKLSPLPVTNEDLHLHVALRVAETIHQPACGISISNEQGVLMTCINTVEQGTILDPLLSGEVNLMVKLNRVPFLPGRYTASFWVMNPQGHIYAMAENAIVFEIAQSPLYGTSQVDHRWGCVYTGIEFGLEARGTVSV